MFINHGHLAKKLDGITEIPVTVDILATELYVDLVQLIYMLISTRQNFTQDLQLKTLH